MQASSSKDLLYEKKIYIASDHAGFELKTLVQQYFSTLLWEDLGTRSLASVDYPEIAAGLCQKLAVEPTLGILICGTGIGMAITANRYPHIRAAVVENALSAKLSKEHNHTNVLCLGARIIAPFYAYTLITTWLSSQPSQEARHSNRIHFKLPST